MYELRIKSDKRDVNRQFKSVYDLEVYLDENDLPMLCLASLRDLNKSGAVSALISHNKERLMIICSRKEESLTG